MPKLNSHCARRSLLALSPAHAQDAVDVAKAKAEGKVIWYTSTPIEQAQKIVALFKQQTGIEVELFRSGGSAILSRFQQEMAAGRVRGRRDHPFGARRRQARSTRRVTSCLQAEEFRQDPGRRQGRGRHRSSASGST